MKTDSLAHETLRILKPFWLPLVMSIVLGIVGGLSVTALIATINRALNAEGGPSIDLALIFAGLCVLSLAASTVSKLLTNHVGQHVIGNLRRELAAKILVAPIEQLERFRGHRLIPVLFTDVLTISNFALSVAPMIIAFTVTVGCLTYLAILSWQILSLTALTVVIGCGAQYLAHRYGSSSLIAAREGEDDLQKHYNAISAGAKELRIQRERRLDIQNNKINATTERICNANIRAAAIFISAETFGSMLFFAVIGMTIGYLALSPATDKTVLGGFVLVMLYMKSPLEQLVNALPGMSRAKVAFRQISELSSRFSSSEARLLEAGHKQTELTAGRIELKQVRYDYPQASGAQTFSLGPVNLCIEPGEITFIVGENGSGKTTLIKLLLGLYTPQQGDILLDGHSVDEQHRDQYRQLFTTVFTDYYLFDELLQGHSQVPEAAMRYLERLDIAHKVSIRDGSFTTTDLSTGQRKRLALINAWLDDRPVLVFDEWAADQDPAFRRVFYTELLPELKQQGKTIIVISHDDRYFDTADQLVYMNTGKVVCERVEAGAVPA